MRKGQPLPTLWMMSDERMGDAFLPALARMPKGSGLIFRHYATSVAERRALFRTARRIVRARRMVILLAGSPQQARGWRADGVHTRASKPVARPLMHSAPVHTLRELVAARKGRPALYVLSPVFPTASHPGGATLGARGVQALARQADGPVIALGGMTSVRFKSLKSQKILGWAAIDALLR